MAKRVAVVDIGTNTLLLLIVQSVDGRLDVLVDECRFGRLGQGLDQTGDLAPEAVERCLTIVGEYRALMDEHQVTDVTVVATQALREARNAAEFVEPAQQLFGAAIEVIAGEREAQLVYQAVANSLPELAAQPLLVVDVGGGSTEFILARGGAVESYRSIPIGSVRHSERYLKDDPPSADQVASLLADVDESLAALALPSGVTVVGTAGTATSIASIALQLSEWDPDRVQGFRLAASEVDAQLSMLLETSLAQRSVIAGLEPKRADVIAAGVAIYSRVLQLTGTAELIVSDRGVRWGVAYSLLG